jgi:putative MATE family efflux protein
VSKNSIGRDLTSGSIPRHLLAVALPMLLGNFINTCYSIVDAIWIGRIAGTAAIGAIAVSFPVIFLFISVASGATMATTILISQYYGARNYKQVSKTVDTSFGVTIILAVIFSVLGILSVDHILVFMSTPWEILPLASSYMKISYMGFTAILLTFLVTSILRGVGDTRTPLFFMSLGVVVNAILDPLLIIGVGPLPTLGLDGAAIASIIAQAIALITGLIYLNSRKGIITVRLKKIFCLDGHITWLIAKIGFPSIVQQSAISLGMAAVTSFVNSFGETATAAFGAAGRIDSLAFLPAMSIGMSVSVIAGQNLGAGKNERVFRAFRWGIFMTLCISGFFSIFFLSIPGPLVSIFTTDKRVIEIGSTYLRIVGTSSIMFAVMQVSNGVINGAGHTMVTLIFTILAMWGIRVPFASILSKSPLGLTGIWFSFTIGFAVIMTASLIYYHSGRWQKAVIHPTEVTEALVNTENALDPLVVNEPLDRGKAGI